MTTSFCCGCDYNKPLPLLLCHPTYLMTLLSQVNFTCLLLHNMVITVGDFTNLPRLKHKSKVYKVLNFESPSWDFV